MRFSVRKKRRLPIGLSVLLLCGSALALFWFVEAHLKPTLLAIAEARATVIATQTINNVINEQVSTAVDPQKLVSVRVDDHGRVVLMQPNTMEFNRLAADTTIKVQNALRAITEDDIQIPMGQVFGSQILASWGPRINVTVIPIGTVQVKLVDKFEQAGINQTRHSIYLTANTQVRIVVPLVSKSVVVSTQMPVAEYIVVGEVPNTYVQFPFPIPNDNSAGNGNGNNGTH